MIAAGGTGGHINPALSFARMLEAKDPSVKIIFVGSQDRLESVLIPEAGYRFIPLSIANTHGSLIHKVAYGFSLLEAYRSCKALLNEYQPDGVVGFGNYISVPLLLAAHQKKIPTMISEQNSFAGKANVFLGKYVDAVELAYESSLKDFDSSKARVLGNPVGYEAMQTKKNPEGMKAYGIDPLKPMVSIMMGSLGSSSVSKVVDEAIPYLDSSYQVLISIGQHNEYTFHNKKENVILKDYVDGKMVLRHSDLCVCRAGATTLCEITSIGVASILIPSPYVPNNHQVCNAKVLEDAGASKMIEEKDLTAKGLADTLNAFMKDHDRLRKMADKARNLAKDDAAEQMVNWLEEIVNG